MDFPDHSTTFNQNWFIYLVILQTESATAWTTINTAAGTLFVQSECTGSIANEICMPSSRVYSFNSWAKGHSLKFAV